MARVLFATIDMPGDTFGSNKRSFHFVKALAQESFDVEVVCFSKANANDDPAYLEALGVKYTIVHAEPGAEARRSSRKDKLKHLLQAMPFEQSAASWLSPLGKKITELCQAGSYDVCIVDYEIASCLYDFLPKNTPSILNSHTTRSDVKYRDFRFNRQKFGYSPYTIESLIQAWKWRTAEKVALRNYSTVISVCQRDKDLWEASSPKIKVIENGIDSHFQKTASVQTEENQVLFIGKLTYDPNEDAALWLLQEIWPLVIQKRPQAKLVIVGADPTERILKLAESAINVTVTGFVESAIPYFENSALVVAPLRLGGGTRVKILEAASMGCSIIATSVGAEGIDSLIDRESIYISDTAPAFAEAIVELLGSPDRARSLGSKAREAIAKRYDWPVIESNFAQAVKDLL